MLTPLALFGLVTTVQQLSAEEIYQTVSPSIMTLSVDRPHGVKSVGTAFLAVRKNVAVTAWHVLKGARSITAKFSDGTEVKVEGIIDKDPERDIALIQLDSGDRALLPLENGDPRVGSKAFVIGAPKGMEFSISDGIISQTPSVGSSRLYQFTCPVSSGNSGGPLLNGAGHVVGVVSWQLKDAQNLNFAIPASQVENLDQAKAAVPFLARSNDPALDGRIVRTADDKLLQQLLTAEGWEASQSDDGTGKTAFLFDCDGTRITLFQYPENQEKGPTANLGMSVGYRATTATDLAKLNAFNRSRRFARTYKDAEGILYLENDIDLSQGVSVGNVSAFLSEFAVTVQEFEQEIFSQTTKGRLRQDADEASPAVTPVDDAGLTALLKEMGHTATASDDGSGKNRLLFKVGRSHVNLYQYADGGPEKPTTSLTLSVGFDLPKKADLAKVNEFNETTRFVKAFLDDEGDPFMVADLDLTGGVTPQTVKNFVKTFLRILPQFESQIVK